MIRRLAFAAVLASATLATAGPEQPPPRWQTLPLPPAMPEPAEHGTVDANGASIYYAVYGTGAPVVMLHGGLGNGDHWANQVPALADKFRVIAIDSRGHGRSTRSRGKISYDAMASDVIAVLDHLAIQRASVVGWSDGGEVALKLAIGHPDRVDRLFVVATNYDASGSKPRGTVHSTFTRYAAKCRADYEHMSKTPRQFDELVDWLMPLWRNPMGFSKDQLRSIGAPTMIADGDHDEVIELDQEREMAKLIPHGSIHVFEDTSHFTLWQDPADFNRVLVDFLSAH